MSVELLMFVWSLTAQLTEDLTMPPQLRHPHQSQWICGAMSQQCSKVDPSMELWGSGPVIEGTLERPLSLKSDARTPCALPKLLDQAMPACTFAEPSNAEEEMA